MQNKGLVRIMAILLTLVCAFYLSFSIITSRYDKKAKEYAGGVAEKEYVYLDSIASKKAKDCAAGAVLVAAIGAAIVGCIIFVSKLLAFVWKG